NPYRCGISISLALEDQDLVPLRDKDFPMYSIHCYGLRIEQSCTWSENLPHGGNIPIGVSAESEDRKRVERRYEDFVVHRIVRHVVNRAGKQSILSGNGSHRLCTTIRQPGECRNLRMGHSV